MGIWAGHCRVPTGEPPARLLLCGLRGRHRVAYTSLVLRPRADLVRPGSQHTASVFAEGQSKRGTFVPNAPGEGAGSPGLRNVCESMCVCV